MDTVMFKWVFSLLFCFTLVIGVAAQGNTLSGTVTTEINDEVIPGVTIEIPKLGISTETDENGKYVFNDLPSGSYTLVTHIEGFSDRAVQVKVTAGAQTLDLKLSIRAFSGEVNVTATGEEESVFNSFSSVNSVGSTGIIERASSNIGDVLGDQAGISVRSFGAGGTGRPSIRSFEGDRVLITQDGIRNGSVGAASGDHGEPISAVNLERLEVIKGPATLLYGSNAIGGVVNAVSTDKNEAHDGFRGYFSTFGGSINRQGGIAGGLEFGAKKNLFELNLNSSREGDFNTPLGKIPNSGARSHGGSGSWGYLADKGFFRASVNIDRRRYGIPYAPLFESRELLSIINGGADCGGKEEGKEPDCQFDPNEVRRIFANQLPPLPDEQIDIDMDRNNFRFVGGFRDVKGPISRGTFTVDFTDYQHFEVETEDGVDEIATSFFNDTFSYRAIFNQKDFEKLSGQFGFEGYRRSYLTVGAESLIDGRVRQNNFAVFGLQSLNFEKVALQFGARVESNRYRPANGVLPDLSFTGLSASVGVRFEVWKDASIVASFSSSYRPPALEELYNNGPHIGTVLFEIGDANLQHERSNGFELSFRQRSNRVRFNGSFFYNDIKDFIYGAPVDEDGDGRVDVEDGLPIAGFVQGDARYVGADASLEADINNNFGVFVVGDIVDAELKTPGFSPPRIAPARLRAGVDIRYKSFSFRPEGVFVSERGAGDIFALESPTDGYSLFNINGSYAFVVNKTAHIITFGGQNLTNKLYRNHSNFLKDIVPQPGRGFKVSYTVRLF
ncbi:MAG: TonB-dependent receptor [Pyrinomonadaceae bacterium]|nr:TonB-dependent receptor [Pyrinomonadaceae bacterium]